MANSENAIRLKKIREFLGYSQRELASDFQVTSGAIAHWESGDRPIPGPILKLLEIYEKSLGLSLNQDTLLSNEALQASRELLKITISTLRQEGVHFQEDTEKKLHNVIGPFLREAFLKDQVGGRIKLAIGKQLLKSLKGSRGLSIKAAQMASFLELGLPPEIAQLLGDLQSMGKPLPTAQIQGLLRQAYSAPIEKVFSKFNSKPMAVTSLAQLHRATLVSGEDVVVKIQHPVIADILTSQFKKLSFVVSLGSLLGRSFDEVLNEISTQVFLELDYEREVINQERFRNMFEGEPRIVIPKIFKDLCTKNIIVSSFESGFSFATFSARASAEEKSHAALLIAYFQSFAIFRRGFMHGDTHPSNFLFRKDQVVFLDFGRVIEYEPEEVEKERVLYMALLHKNKSLVHELLKARGFVPDSESFDFDEFWRLILRQQEHHLVDGRFKITKDHIKSVQNENRHFQDRNKLKVDRFLLRSLLVNTSLLNLFAELEAEANWRAQSLDVLNLGITSPRFQIRN